MCESHLRETQLACSDTGGADTVGHLRWCAQCRSSAAEYRWLGEQIEDALTATASGVKLPRPSWRAVKRRVVAGRERRAAGWRASATAGLALAICAILSLSSIAGVAVATQTSSPEAVMTPAPVVASIPDVSAISSGPTATPRVSHDMSEAPTALALPSLPTPPDPDI
jgi:hypothetical protein